VFVCFRLYLVVKFKPTGRTKYRRPIKRPPDRRVTEIHDSFVMMMMIMMMMVMMLIMLMLVK